jgi:hypothetical protein
MHKKHRVIVAAFAAAVATSDARPMQSSFKLIRTLY